MLKKYPNNYILVTPAKNEEESLPSLIQSITKQTITPLVWFIVDDCSQDKTSQILSEASVRHSWIHVVRLSVNLDYDVGKHGSYVCITGFNSAIEFCRKNNLEFNFIALSDADMVFPSNYFDECMKFLHNNPDYGLVTGELAIKDKNGGCHKEEIIDIGTIAALGTGRMWAIKAFLETEGYQLVQSADCVSNIMLAEKGWGLKRIKNLIFFQTRDTAGKKGLWAGFYSTGKRGYYLYRNPLSVFNSFWYYLIMPPGKKGFVKSFAYLAGYYSALVKREERIDNIAVKKYFTNYRRDINNYWIFIRELVNIIYKIRRKIFKTSKS